MLSPLSFASFNIADSGISIIFIFCINVKSYFICLKAREALINSAPPS